MQFRNRMFFLLLGCAAIAIMPATVTLGTTVVKMSLAQMTQGASLVVEGVVVDKSSRWDENHRYIITEVSVAVNRTLKGKAISPLTIRTLGGEVGGVGMYVAGSPRFEVGQEALLLLEPHPIRDWRVVGFHQGKYDVISDLQTGRKWARSAGEPNYAPLEDLEARIIAALKAERP